MFDAVIGNEKAKELLTKSIEANKTSHSYLFIGISGVGKSIIAKEFAKELLNKDTQNNPDFILIEPENGSIKIDKIREMQKQVVEKPIISNNKVCLINDADLMTDQAQNCLLKTLEEPPTYMTIILIGVSEASFLETIKSRCTIMHFNPIKDEDIKKYLQEKYGDEAIPQTIIDIANGSIGKVIDIKDKSDIYEGIYTVIENLEKYDLATTLKKAEIIYKSKEEIFEILEYINVLLIKKTKEKPHYANCIKLVEETKKRIKANSNYNMCIDYMLFGIWEEVNEKYSRGQV